MNKRLVDTVGSAFIVDYTYSMLINKYEIRWKKFAERENAYNRLTLEDVLGALNETNDNHLEHNDMGITKDEIAFMKNKLRSYFEELQNISFDTHIVLNDKSLKNVIDTFKFINDSTKFAISDNLSDDSIQVTSIENGSINLFLELNFLHITMGTILTNILLSATYDIGKNLIKGAAKKIFDSLRERSNDKYDITWDEVRKIEIKEKLKDKNKK